MDCGRALHKLTYIEALRRGVLLVLMLLPGLSAILSQPSLAQQSPASSGPIKQPPAKLHRNASPLSNDMPSGFFPGAINIFAGNGTPDGAYVNGSAPTQVSIGSAAAVTADSQGNIYFAGDSGYTIYVVFAGGTVPPLLAAVTTQAASPVTPVAGDIYQITAVSSTCFGCYTDGIVASQAYFNNITGMSFDASGNLYIAAGLNMYSIFEINAASTQVHVVAGQFDIQSTYSAGDTINDVPATSIQLNLPEDVKTDSFGNIYIADNGNDVALVVYSGTQPPPVLAAEGVSVTASDKGNIYTIAGQVENFCFAPGTCTDSGPALGSLIGGAISLSVDASGNIYILDNFANTVRLIYVGGTAPPLLSAFPNPQTGSMYAIAGLNTQFTPCSAAPCGDGMTAANLQLNQPFYLATDASGNVYIDDELDYAIRKVDTSGLVSTVAGIADPTQTPPTIPVGGGAATSTPLSEPLAIAFDPQDNLYIADAAYNLVWKVGPSEPQTITFPRLDSPVTYGAAQIPLDATASSGLAVQYSVTGPAIVSGSGSTASLNLTGAGSVTVTATQSGNSEFGAAPPISQTITVNKALLTVTAQSVGRVYGQPNPAFNAIYTGFVGADTQASSLTGQPLITTTATATSSVGVYPLTITQGSLASANYTFTFVNGTLTISGSTAQTISFPPIAPVTFGQAPLTLNATATSGLPITYAVVSGPGTISGSTLTITGGGTIVITAAQSGNNTYAQATPVTQSLIVKPALLTVTAPTLTYPFGTTINTANFPPPAITGFVGTDTAALVTGAAQYTTNASGTPAGGTYTLTVSQGTLALVPSAAANYVLANFVAGSLTIGPASQTISTLPLPPITYNTLYSITASASSGLPVTFTATGPIAFLGSNVTSPATGNTSVQFYANGIGPATLTATQAGSTNYAAAQPIVLSFVTNKAELDIQANNLIQEQGAPTPNLTYVIGANVQAGPLGGFLDIPAIVSGIPVLTTAATPTSPPGTYPIVPSVGTLVSPVYFFKFINGTLTITQPGSFIITANPSSLTIARGMSGQATLTITPMNAYQGTITLGCGQLPANVSCVISPATYNFPGSQNADGSENAAQGTITINTQSGTVVGALPAQRSTLLQAAFLFPGAIATVFLVFARKRFMRSSSLWSLCCLMALSLGLLTVAACGGGSKSSLSGNAAPGNVVVTINGSGTTPAGNASVTASVPLNVTIQ